MDENKLKSWIAPDINTRTRRLNTFKQYVFYGIIAAILIIILFIVPLISGGITANDFGYYLPKTVNGWIVFWAIRGGTVAGNMCIYGLFKAQAKTNAKDHPNFKKANEILNKLYGTKEFIPHSPKQKNVRDWLTKGITVFIATGLESIVIGSLIFNWDNITFLSCIVSSITAVLFGLIAMVKDEQYWTEEYLAYAEYVTKKLAKESPEIKPETNETAQKSNVSEVGEELPQKEEKEAQNA